MTGAELRQWVDANPPRVNDWDRGEDGMTPLYVAVCYIKSLPLVLRLLDENGADVNKKIYNGQTPLHAARSLDVLSALLDRVKDPTLLDDYDKSPLMYHTNLRGIDVVACLLQDLRVRATVDVQDKDGHTALHFACFRESMDEALVCPLPSIFSCKLVPVQLSSLLTGRRL